MTVNVFEKNLKECESKLRKEKTLDTFTRVITFGFVSREGRVAEARRTLDIARTQSEQYHGLTTHASMLDGQLLDAIELRGVRVSRNTFADFARLGAEGYPLDWESIRRSVLERDAYKCMEFDVSCDGPLQIHHVVPLSHGGDNSLGNLITLCLYHHCTKHDHLRLRYYGNLRR